MTRFYAPDLWSLVEIVGTEETIIKVLATWYGGFSDGDRWKLSSGITHTENLGESIYEMHNYSGSVYTGYKENYGMGGYTTQVLENFILQAGPGRIRLLKWEEAETALLKLVGARDGM